MQILQQYRNPWDDSNDAQMRDLATNNSETSLDWGYFGIFSSAYEKPNFPTSERRRLRYEHKRETTTCSSVAARHTKYFEWNRRKKKL